MRHHLIAASLSLFISACGHDYPTALVTPVAPVAAPVSRAPTAAAAWSDQALPLISHAGRRFVVIASGLDDDAAEGAVRVLSREDLVVTERAPRAAAVPARWRGGERAVRAYTHGGARCELHLGAPTVLSRVIPDYTVTERWSGRDEEGRAIPRPSDAEIAEAAYAEASGGRLLVAEVLDRGCADAAWAQVPTRPAVTFHPDAADEATRRAAIAAYRATEAWRAMQRRFREYSAEDDRPRAENALWDETAQAPEVTLWRHAPDGRTFVTVRGHVPSEGCGFFGGSVWTAYERVGDRLVPRAAATEEGDFVPAHAVDADGDGAPEFLSADEVRALGPTGYETVLSVAYPVNGCPC